LARLGPFSFVVIPGKLSPARHGPVWQIEDRPGPAPSSAYLKYYITSEESGETPETESQQQNSNIIYTDAKCKYRSVLKSRVI